MAISHIMVQRFQLHTSTIQISIIIIIIVVVVVVTAKHTDIHTIPQK